MSPRKRSPGGRAGPVASTGLAAFRTALADEGEPPGGYIPARAEPTGVENVRRTCQGAQAVELSEPMDVGVHLIFTHFVRAPAGGGYLLAQ